MIDVNVPHSASFICSILRKCSVTSSISLEFGTGMSLGSSGSRLFTHFFHRALGTSERVLPRCVMLLHV